jgi:hypothetical protein
MIFRSKFIFVFLLSAGCGAMNGCCRHVADGVATSRSNEPGVPTIANPTRFDLLSRNDDLIWSLGTFGAFPVVTAQLYDDSVRVRVDPHYRAWVVKSLEDPERYGYAAMVLSEGVNVADFNLRSDGYDGYMLSSNDNEVARRENMRALQDLWAKRLESTELKQSLREHPTRESSDSSREAIRTGNFANDRIHWEQSEMEKVPVLTKEMRDQRNRIRFDSAYRDDFSRLLADPTSYFYAHVVLSLAFKIENPAAVPGFYDQCQVPGNSFDRALAERDIPRLKALWQERFAARKTNTP